MKILSIDMVGPERWDEAVDASREAWLYHRSSWVALESRYWVQGNHSFAVEDPRGQIVAVCPLYRRDLNRANWVERLLDSGHHRVAGLAVRDGLPPAERKAAISLSMRHLLDQGSHLEADRLLLGYPSIAPAILEGERPPIPFWVTDYGFQFGISLAPSGDCTVPGMFTVCADQIVFLGKTEECLFQQLDPHCRKAVRKAQSFSLMFHEAQEQPIPDYYNLAHLSAQRTGESLLSQDYYQDIWNAFAAAGRCKVFFARFQDLPVAAIFLLLDKGSVHYMAGVSSPDHLAMQVNTFLHWEVIRWANQQGFRSYRLGPIFPELPAHWPVSTVSRFKSKFGAQATFVCQGSLFLHPEQYLKDGQRALAERIRDMASPVVPDTKVKGPSHGSRANPAARRISWMGRILNRLRRVVLAGNGSPM